MEIDVDGEDEVEIECPHCKKKIVTTVTFSTTVDVDMSDYAPDYSWRD